MLLDNKYRTQTQTQHASCEVVHSNIPTNTSEHDGKRLRPSYPQQPCHLPSKLQTSFAKLNLAFHRILGGTFVFFLFSFLRYRESFGCVEDKPISWREAFCRIWICVYTFDNFSIFLMWLIKPHESYNNILLRSLIGYHIPTTIPCKPAPSSQSHWLVRYLGIPSTGGVTSRPLGPTGLNDITTGRPFKQAQEQENVG